jgi:Domain of unknown function (DUF1772)
VLQNESDEMHGGGPLDLVHRIADRRFAAIAVGGLITAIATAALAAATGHWVSTAAGALATLVLLTFTAIYTRISKLVNAALTAAAVADQVPDDARQLQARWDSVINGRVALQAIALAALCVALQVKGEVLYLTFRAHRDGKDELVGTDTFVIRDGLIHIHTFYATTPSPTADSRP